MDANTVVLTLGEEGSLIGIQNKIEKIKAFPVKAIGTTAAGDVYCGSLATALVEGKQVNDAVKLASAAAALSVTKPGAQPSAPFRKEIDEFLIKKQ